MPMIMGALPDRRLGPATEDDWLAARTVEAKRRHDHAEVPTHRDRLRRPGEAGRVVSEGLRPAAHSSQREERRHGPVGWRVQPDAAALGLGGPEYPAQVALRPRDDHGGDRGAARAPRG